MNIPLFSEFSASDKEAWKQQAIKDLKGKDFAGTLLWKTAEGLTVQPYYAAEDTIDERLTSVREAQQKPAGWLNQPEIGYESEKTTNAEMKAVLSKGADAVLLVLDKVDAGQIDFSKLFDGIKLSETPVFLQTNGQSVRVIEALLKCLPYQWKGGLADDGLAQWMTQGHWPETYFEGLASVISATRNSPQFRAVCVSSHVFHNAGANAVQELAFTLASAVTYLDKLTDLGLTSAEVMKNLCFSVSVGTNYFMEIAKLRALRYLWGKIESVWLSEDGTEDTFSLAPCYIHAKTSSFYSAAVTADTNMLRATTEAMSAVLGGCNALTVRPYDAELKKTDDFSARIARNVSVLLKEEAHLDKAIDPAAGSYYLDTLTLQMADAAWDLFLEVEAKGGLPAAFEADFIQMQIEANFESALFALQTGQRLMVGVNKFRVEENLPSSPKPKSEEAVPVSFRLLKNKRISETFES
ncbi:MAG: methylmalonyl-CoA mutase family protein [Spirosomataceae bacterium]